jgi:hypothetical protein
MTTHFAQRRSFFVLLATVVVLAWSSSVFAGGATIVIFNIDGANEGFNDPTPAAPVGGNTGTTLGQQRLIAFQHAATIWGAELDSNQTIVIQAAFNPLGPGILGSAGATFVVRDFGGAGLHPGAEFPATWYGAALAEKRAGVDFAPGVPDIAATFSSNFVFYLGLDNNHGALPDLVTVLLHEFGHGLNFQNFVTEATGANFLGFTDIYARKTLDTTNSLYWDQMTNAQRAASAIRFGRVVWDGPTVTSEVPDVLLFGNPEFKVTAPPAIAGSYQFGTAAFGPSLTSLPSDIVGSVVVALDPSNSDGPSTTDGCSPLTNASAISNNIALVDRGTCTFPIKVKNAQNAGAKAVIVANNAIGAPPGMSGADPTIIIPAVSVTQTDGNLIRTNLPVTVSIGKDITVRAGADPLGRARLYMPDPVVAGSSGSHYDSIAFRNLLMEPAINSDLTHKLKSPDDLTLELLRDVGWFPDADLEGLADDLDACPSSDLRSTIFIGSVNTGVTNDLLTNGCTLSDLIVDVSADAETHGEAVSSVAHLLNVLLAQGLITAEERDLLQSTFARSSTN